MPEPVKAESEPPVTTTSDAVNPVTDSLKLKLRMAVWPAASVERLDVIVTVGATVSPAATMNGAVFDPTVARVPW